MKEMVGGCCVCSDEHGWTENPLVYCDGQNCTVAVHQACYGIVTVPTGPWYCRKCESQERSARVRCELCPSRDGALKKTDNQGWAHVVCALYIPEVRFGNVTTMEPIILQLIPQERFAKTCYICTENSKPSRATAGACMQCNKSGCKQQFHVTCAQALGLLCEEAGNYLDNVKYCGYCQHHYSKLKKGGNVKTIPPYKPITHETGSSDSPSSPEKETTTNSSQNISTIPSGSSSSSTTIKITQSSASSSSVSIMPALPPATSSTSSSSSSKQRKSSSASKNSSNSSSSIINNMSSGSAASLGGGSGGSSSNQNAGGGGGSSSSKSNSSSTKDKEKHSKSVSSSKSSSKNDKNNDLSSTSSTANLSNSSSSTRDKRDSKSSKSSSNSSSNNNKDDSLTINASSSSSSSNKISSSTQQGNILSSSSTSSSSSLHKDSISSKTAAALLTTTAAASSTQNEILTNVSQLQDPVQIYANTNSNTSSSNITNDTNTSGNSSKGNNSTNNITSGGNNSGSGSTSIAKKRKAESSSSSSSSSKSTTIDDLNKDLIKDVSVTIVPITNIDKLDSMDFDKNSKKSKTSDSSTSSLSSASLQIINEPNLQNVSPNQNINPQQPVPQLPPPQSQQPNLKPSSLNIISSTIQSSQSIVKPLVLKEVNDSRLHSTGQQNSISPFSGAGSQLPQAPILPIVQQQQQQSSQSQQQQQSLVVSVPLSNAGVNIPSNNTIQTNNNQAIHQGSGLYQHMTQTREQLSASSGSRASPIVNYQQNHQTSTLPSNLGRKSPLIQGAALSPSPHLNELNMHSQPLQQQQPQQQQQQQQQQQNISVLQNVSPSLVNNSNAISVNCSNPNNTSSSGGSIMTSSSSAIATTSDTGMLKITYEKQPNSRIAQLQDDIPARRSSRSQSNESSKSRTSKKRALIPPSSSPSTASTSSSLGSSVFPENNSASTSNSCHHSNNNNNNNNNSNSNNSVNNISNSKSSILSPSQFPPTIIGHQSNIHVTNVSAPIAPNNNNNNNVNANNNNNSNNANNHNNNNNKKQTAVSSRIQTNETPPPSTSRTPDTNYTTISYGGGLKFTYEAQPNTAGTGTPSTQSSSLPITTPVTVVPPVSVTPQPIKDSPPSSPGSEAGSRKRTRKSIENKNDVKIFQNGVVATHMLGNQINPASSVAQKMTDQLNMEIEAHSIYTSTSLDSGPQLVGPPYPGKSQSNSRSSSTQPGGLGSILSGSSSSSQSGNSHQSLEQLLERQWEQGSQFLMEQAQHFDIASLLSCLHQLRTENIRLEDHVNNLVARRDHLLAVNARLAIPLNPPVAPQAQGPYNNMHINGPSDIPPNLSSSRSNRTTSSSQQSSQQQSHFNAQQQQQQQQQPQPQSQIIENGVDFRGHGAITGPGHQIPTNPSSRHGSMSYTSTHNSSSSRQQQQQSSISMNIDQQQTSRSRTFQQTNYSTAHQPQLRPDDSQVKPS